MRGGAACDRATFAGGNAEPEHATHERCQEIFGRPRGEQCALVQQQYLPAARRLIEVGGGPDHGHAFVAAFLQHRRHDRPEFAA